MKNAWAGEIGVPGVLREAPAAYLHWLREDLRKAVEIAEDISDKRQSGYAGYYTRTAPGKQFAVGQQVLLHDAVPSSKMHARCNEPYTVLTQERQHPYVIEDANSEQRTVHMNKLRVYQARDEQTGVVFQGDEDFGEISYAPLIQSDIHR